MQILSILWVVRKPRHSEVSHMRKSQMGDNSLKQLTEINIEDREIGNKLRNTGNRWKNRNWVCQPIPYTIGSNAVPITINQ